MEFGTGNDNSSKTTFEKKMIHDCVQCAHSGFCILHYIRWIHNTPYACICVKSKKISSTHMYNVYWRGNDFKSYRKPINLHDVRCEMQNAKCEMYPNACRSCAFKSYRSCQCALYMYEWQTVFSRRIARDTEEYIVNILANAHAKMSRCALRVLR